MVDQEYRGAEHPISGTNQKNQSNKKMIINPEIN